MLYFYFQHIAAYILNKVEKEILKMVLSPITSKPAKLIKSIPVSLIIDLYKTEVDINVASYFKDMEDIYIYRCEQTGYNFYYPFSLSGNDVLYEMLQKYEWYYQEWKWDYDAAMPFISPKSKVLDIGCGNGDFLQRLKNDKQCDCTGLEFNDKAVHTGRSKGLNIRKEFLSAHVKNPQHRYDFVCFFQVLEHIADINDFMTDAINCVKPGGTIIICVPNNNPYFYKHVEYHSLNMPPHHMGLWSDAAFRKLPTIYPLKLNAIRLQTLNRFFFYTKNHINSITKNKPVKKKLLTLITPLLTAYFVLQRKNIVVGHILAVYDKP